MKRSNLGRDNKETNKLWSGSNYLKRVDSETTKHIDIRREKDH